MNIFGKIYKITNSFNGKVYIGQTTGTLERRWASHKNASSGCVKLQKAIAKYGPEAFSVDTIYVATDRQSLDEAESQLIEGYGSAIDGYNTLTFSPNDCVGERNPFYGRKHSAESRAKIKAARAKQVIRHSPATKEKIRMAQVKHPSKVGKRCSIRTEFKPGLIPWNIGVPHTDELKQTLRMTNPFRRTVTALKDEISLSFTSLHEAAKATNVDRKSISQCCRGIRQSAGGYRWIYAN